MCYARSCSCGLEVEYLLRRHKAQDWKKKTTHVNTPTPPPKWCLLLINNMLCQNTSSPYSVHMVVTITH